MKVFSSTVLAAASLATAVAAAYDRYAPINNTIMWQPCNSNNSFSCATFDVPLDYANVTTGKATLMMIKYPAAIEPRLGSIFLNPGGPGGSGVDFIVELGQQLMQTSGGQYDLVGWDPRGVGYTFPKIDCFSSPEEQAEFWQGNLAYFGIEAKGNFTNADQTDPDVKAFWTQEPQTNEILEAVGQRCWERNGDNLFYIGTAANARDIVAMSEVLEGSDKLINYWGFSYGTVIGSYLVNMFPDKVGRVIIDGVVNPVLWADGPSYKAWGYKLQDTDAVFAGFAGACAMAGPRGCAIAGPSSTQESIIQWTHDLMDASYDYMKSGGTYGSAFVRNYIFQAMYAPKRWPQLATDLYDVADFLYNGNTTNTTKRSLPVDRFGRKIKRETDPTTYDYAFPAITCADAADSGNTTTVDVFNEIVSAARYSSQMFAPAFADAGFWCHKWPARAVERFAGPWNHTLKTPILVIGNEADPITPYAGAKLVADMLGDSAVLVEQDDYGHSSLAEHSDCTIGIIQRFFFNGTYPAEDQFCGTNQVLFPVSNVTKQSLALGKSSSPLLDVTVPVPGTPKNGKPNVLSSTPNESSNPSTSSNTQQLEDEIKDLKDLRRTLYIALGAVGLAFLLSLLVLVITLIRSRRKRSAYVPAVNPAAMQSKRDSGIGHRRDDSFTPRESAETLKGYSDPYDTSGALGSYAEGGKQYRDRD